MFPQGFFDTQKWDIDIVNSFYQTIRNYDFDVKAIISSPLQQLLQRFDYSLIYEALIANIRDRKAINQFITTETLDLKWFPHAICADNGKMRYDFLYIINSTKKGSANRRKK